MHVGCHIHASYYDWLRLDGCHCSPALQSFNTLRPKHMPGQVNASSITHWHEPLVSSARSPPSLNPLETDCLFALEAKRQETEARSCSASSQGGPLYSCARFRSQSLTAVPSLIPNDNRNVGSSVVALLSGRSGGQFEAVGRAP